MGLADKKRDTLVSIQGKSASIYRKDIALLIAGELPPDWQTVPSSDEAFVAFNKKTNTYYKEFLPRNIFEKFKAFFRGSRCQRALQQTEFLRKAGLPTPDILCWGKGKKNTFLISEGFTGVGFYDFLEAYFTPPLSRDQIQEKRLLFKEAGSLIGRLHSKGILHGDLRPNNVLTRKDSERFQFSFIDTESNRKKKILSPSHITKNLVQFSMIKSEHLSRTDLLRLYKSYRAEFPCISGNDELILLRKIYSRSKKRIIEAIVSNFLKKHCRSFHKGNFQGKYVTPSLLEEKINSGCDLREWFDSRQERLKKDKNISIKLLHANGQEVIVKRFTSKNFLYHLKVWTRKERALRLWEMTHHFNAIGIPVAQPIGYALEGHGIWRTTSYFYSQYLKGKSDMKRLSQTMNDFPGWLENKKVIIQFADLLATLHNNGFCHGDTKWKNIMADQETGKLWIIDLDGATSARLPLSRAMCKDISRFIVDMVEYPLPDHLIEAFLHQYCGRRNLKRNFVKEKTEPHVRNIIERHRNQKRSFLKLIL
jgi:tRNA A-37 threonylcarbamoyl transferase component Bud32